MRTRDLHEIPKIRDKLSYLYVEHARVEQEELAIAIYDANGVTPVPCAGLTLLLLGPGVSISHAAILTLADNGCLVAWTGENGVRFYAAGTGTTRSAANLLRQAALWANKSAHLRVVRTMYEIRFPDMPDRSLTLQQLRGMEGVRVRDAYYRASKETGLSWQGRTYQRTNWQQADPINRALSVANSCLYGICHAAIVAAGYSPAIGFIHTGKQLSFVYDIADLYKTQITIPVAFHAVAANIVPLDREVRLLCRDAFVQSDLLKRIVGDIHRVIGQNLPTEGVPDDFDTDPAKPGELWDPVMGNCPGGVSYGETEEKT